MATLVAFYTSDGCVGRCDAKCYKAKGEHCNCICGGMNHGAGLAQARRQTAQYAKQWLADFVLGRGDEVYYQPPLELEPTSQAR